MFHQVSQWNSISEIARPAPGVSQQPFPLPKYPEIPQYEVPPKAFSLVRMYSTDPVGYTHSRHWPDEAGKSQVVCSWACDNFRQDDLQQRFRDLTCPPGHWPSSKIMHNAASRNIVEPKGTLLDSRFFGLMPG